MKTPEPTESIKLKINGMVLWHEYYDGHDCFMHRIRTPTKISEWKGYCGIAKVDVGVRSFHATTEYYDGVLPSVFESLTPS